MDPVAATIRDPAELDIQVDQLAGVLALTAHHRPAGPVGVGEPAHAMAAQDPIDGRVGHPEVVAEPLGTLAAAPTGGQHPMGLAGRQSIRAAMGPRGSVGQARWALGR